MKNSRQPSAVSRQPSARGLPRSESSPENLLTDSRWLIADSQYHIHSFFAALTIFMLTSITVNAVTFTEVTNEAGIDFQHSGGTRSSLLPEDMGSGAGFADIDNDGDIDLYIVNIPGPFTQDRESNKGNANALYRNNGDGTFTDITRTAGVGHQGYGMGCVFADYDGDADLEPHLSLIHISEPTRPY